LHFWWSESYLWKHLFLFRGFLIMKTTFSYFPGMFENPAPAVCNIWMICLELNLFVYDLSWMLHLSEFVWTLCSSVLVVFDNFLLIDATDRSKIRSFQKRFFIALSLYPHSFFWNTPFNYNIKRHNQSLKVVFLFHGFLIITVFKINDVFHFNFWFVISSNPPCSILW